MPKRSETKLTKTVVSRLPAPDPSGKQTLHWDSDLTGFAVLCSGTTNGKSYVVRHTLQGGKTRRVTAGPVNVLDLDEARARARTILAGLYAGVDPKANARGLAAATLNEVLEAYLTSRKDLRASTITDYRCIVERYLSDWIDRPIRSITPDMVEVVNCTKPSSNGAGNRALRRKIQANHDIVLEKTDVGMLTKVPHAGDREIESIPHLGARRRSGRGNYADVVELKSQTWHDRTCCWYPPGAP